MDPRAGTSAGNTVIRGHSRSEMPVRVSTLHRIVRPRWIVITLCMLLGALAVRITMLDDSWLRVLLAGGDRIGLLARERRIHLEQEHAAKALPALERFGDAAPDAPAPVRNSPP